MDRTYPSVIMYTCHIRTSRGNLPSRHPILTMLHLERRHTIKVGRKEFELWRGTRFLMCLTAEIRQRKLMNSYTSRGKKWIWIDVTKNCQVILACFGKSSKIPPPSLLLWSSWRTPFQIHFSYGSFAEKPTGKCWNKVLLPCCESEYYLQSHLFTYRQGWWYLHWLSGNPCSCSVSDSKFCI